MISALTIGVAKGCVYALVAVGYALVYRTTGIVNFAQGCFVMLGGMLTWYFLEHVAISYPFAILGGLLGAGIAGFLMYILLVLPLWRRRAAPFSVLLSTLAFSALVSNIVGLSITNEPQTLPPWFFAFRVNFGGNSVDGQYLLVLAFSIPILLVIAAFLRWTDLGRSMRACAASRGVSELLGISPERIAMITLIATGMLGGLGGALITPAQFTSASEAPLAYGIFGFIASILGGLGTFHGAMVGGLLIGIIQSVVSRYVGSDFDPAILYGVLVVLLAIAPKGIFGDPVEGHAL